MNFKPWALIAAVAFAGSAAQATVTETAALYTDPAAPSGPITYGFETADALPSWLSFSGGWVFTDTDPGVGSITARPPGSLGEYWWSVGPSSPQTPTGTVSFGNGATSVSFLWGSPDTYNVLRYTYSSGG